MKTITILLLLLFASSAYGQLTKEDIRTLIKEEVRPIIKEEIAASEKRMKEYIDLKIDGVEKSLNAKIDGVDNKLSVRIDGVDEKLNWVWYMMIGLIGLVTAAIAVPQILVAYRGRKDMQSQIDQLREQIEALQNPSS